MVLVSRFWQVRKIGAVAASVRSAIFGKVMQKVLKQMLQAVWDDFP